jgi:hypothetical protein
MHIDGPVWSVSCEGPHAVIGLEAGHSLKLELNYVDARGNDADVLGNVAWISSDSDAVRIEADVPGFIAVLTAGARFGRATIRATAEANIGLGPEPVVFSLDVEVDDLAELA